MEILFFVLGAVALISGGLVVFQPHPLRSALWLIVNFFAVAGIYLLAHAEFIAAIQVIVYAGAIIVLFLFVIMLLNLRRAEETPVMPYYGQKLAGIYLLAHAEFIAAIQVIVYAGAIMVLFLFVIMLLNLRQPEATPKFPFFGQKLGGIILAAFTALILFYGFTQAKLPAAKEMAPGLGNTESIARSLFTDYLLPFEVTSVLLLVAIVGAVVLAKTKLK